MRKILLSITAIILLLITIFYLNTFIDTKATSTTKKNEMAVDTSGSVEYDADNSRKQIDDIFYSHLPLLLIETNGKTITKEDIIWSQITVIDNKNGKNHLDDTPNIQTASTLKFRGNSSYFTFDKKQYRLEFYEKTEGTKKKDISVIGMAKESDWVLYGPFLDRTLLRNSLIYGISREVMEWAPDSRYCEVFLDREYQGVYLMVESVKVSNNRIAAKDFSLINGQTAYLLKRERSGTEVNVISNFGSVAAKTGHELSISYPSAQKLSETQKEWITKDISEFERVLYSNNYADKDTGYSAYIDVDSFVDYYIINEFAMIMDAGYLSTYVYKDLGGKLKMSVWDFNNAFDNYPWIAINPYDFYVYKNNWYERLFQDRSFTEKVIRRYRELRSNTLSEEYLLKTIDKKVAYLGNAVDRNFAVWGYTFSEQLMSMDTEGVFRDPRNYEEALTQLENSIIERGRFLDENIETLYRYAVN